MNTITATLTSLWAVVLLLAIPALAGTTSSVTSRSSVVNPDGSVSYKSHTVETKDPVPSKAVTAAYGSVTVPVVTFYYFDPKVSRILSANDLSENVFDIWDTDSNRMIDNHEFYTNQLVVYEPVEYSKRTYQDIDMDGIAELTKEEYTLRLQQVPTYGSLNTDKKEGLTLYEFAGVGFQDADNDNDNQVGYDELKNAFYHHAGLIPKPEKTNR